MVVHDVEVDDVRAGGERRVDLGAELREVRRQDRRRDQEVLLGHDELHLDTGPLGTRARRGQRPGDERICGGEGEGDDEGLHLCLTCVRFLVLCWAVGRDSCVSRTCLFYNSRLHHSSAGLSASLVPCSIALAVRGDEGWLVQA